MTDIGGWQKGPGTGKDRAAAREQLYEQQARRVGCPRCGALAGVGCAAKVGEPLRPGGYHQARHKRWTEGW
jgi:hypothetical protein